MRAIPMALVFVAATASAKNVAVKPVASERQSAVAEFAKLAGKVAAAREEAKKTSGAPNLTASNAKTFAGEYKSFAKEFKSAEGWYNAGALYEEAGDIKGAEDAYNAALEMNGGRGCAHAGLGGLAYRNGDAGKAGSEFEAALRDDPKCVQGYNGSALMLFDRGRQSGDQGAYREAIGKLRRALAVDADSITAYSLLALIYYTIAENDRSKLDLAELVCKQAKEVNEGYPQIYNTLGLIKLRKRNVTGALGEFKTAVKWDPKYVEAQLNIGAITLSARDYKTSETAFQAVIDARPRNPAYLFDATIGMGVALRGQRRIDEAEQWYAKAKQLDARNCAVAYNLGVLYQDYKSGAEPELNKAKGLLQDFLSCGRADREKISDAQRRIKDIDDTFKALQEQKKLEEENKKLQEEAEKIQKQQEEQMKAQQAAEKEKGGEKNDKPAPPKGK
jgi:tetratricopeptide (TPR) repeat protein